MSPSPSFPSEIHLAKNRSTKDIAGDFIIVELFFRKYFIALPAQNSEISDSEIILTTSEKASLIVDLLLEGLFWRVDRLKIALDNTLALLVAAWERAVETSWYAVLSNPKKLMKIRPHYNSQSGGK